TGRFRAEKQWGPWGMALGGTGAAVAFNVSSLAHFNFGDGEVVMAFWLLSGLVFALRRIELETAAGSKSEHIQSLSSVEDSHKNQPRPQEAVSEPSVRAARAKHN